MIEYENLQLVNKPFFDELSSQFEKFLESGWYILGKNVREFETNFSSYLGSKYCIGLASGLDALILAINAFDFPKGSEIIVQSNTYIAAILAILQNGMKPVLVEPEINTYNIDPQKIEKVITEKTKAIIVVHMYGKSCDMDPILEISQKYNLKVIEDAAQAHGSKYKNKTCGTFGDIAAFSFYPTKNLGAFGDGGAIVTDNEELSTKIKMLRNYGEESKYKNKYIGINSRLDEIQATFLNVKLKHLDQIISHKRELATIYFENLDERYIMPDINNDYYDNFHIYNIRHKERDELKDYLYKNGVQTSIHYPIPPHEQPALKEILGRFKFPISEEIHNTTLSLPISYFHKKDQIFQVVKTLNKFIK